MKRSGSQADPGTIRLKRAYEAPLLTADEIAEARSALLATRRLRPVPGGWMLTAHAREEVHQLAGRGAPEATS